jgi:3'(2'), 5'-bisphosphate nucleotidase
MSPDIDMLLDQVPKLAVRAGEKILAVYGTDFRVHKKYDASPVTEADRLSNQVLLEGLAELTPDIPVISEEADPVPLAERSRWHYVWLVDPLDGTREFIKRNGEFTVNVALVEGNEAVLGVVYVPVSGVCYFAARGRGAFRRKNRGKASPIHTRPFERGSIMVVTGSRSHNVGDAIQQYLNHLGPTRYLPMGSALKSCVIAEGGADLYPRFGLTGEWDTAAAQCVVEQAGGGFVDLDMQPLRYNCRGTLLNPNFLVFGDPSFDWKSPLKASGLDQK